MNDMNKSQMHIIEITSALLERQGYNATGLNQIVAESGAPKGSLYYYFPDGKEQIGAETLLWSGERMAERIRAGLSKIEDAGEAVHLLAMSIANAIEASNFQAGGPLTTVALETATSSERLNLACREAYALMQSAFEEKLVENGFEETRAVHLAEYVLAVFEGSILLSRVQHSGNPLRQAAEHLKAYIKSLEVED
jgi:TetR/AcrR family transcriptional regulator, lmrAB and yxaGH operons repressor